MLKIWIGALAVAAAVASAPVAAAERAKCSPVGCSTTVARVFDHHHRGPR
jgi:hypothetical protein